MLKCKKIFASLLLLLVLIPQLALASPTLKVGDKGWKVRTVQQKLTIIGLKTPITGKYTNTLRRTVRTFQKQNKLQATGDVDDKTYRAILDRAFDKEGVQGIKAESLIKTASRYKGRPYGFGGTTPRAFDCSGYIQYVFKQNKVNMPRMADEQATKGLFVPKKKLRPGDLVVFTTYEPGASHVGLYAGNGGFWHVSSSRGVMLSHLNDEYWRTRYYTGRRILAGK